MILPREPSAELRRVAIRLGALVSRVVFLGGAGTDLLVADPGTLRPRTSKTR